MIFEIFNRHNLTKFDFYTIRIKLIVMLLRTIWYVSNISHQHRYLTLMEYQFEIRKRHYAAHLGYTRYSCCYCGERMFRRDHTMKHLKENHAIIRPVINQDFNDVSLEFP